MSDRPEDDPDAREVSADVIQPYVDWLNNNGRLHFQLEDSTLAAAREAEATDPANPDHSPSKYAGFLEAPHPSNPAMRPAPGTPISLVGDGVDISVPPSGATCSVDLTLSNPISLSVSVINTTSDPPTEHHNDNITWFEIYSGTVGPAPETPFGPLMVGPTWVLLDTGEEGYRFTVAMWSNEWFTRARANLLGGEHLPPVR